MRSKHKMYFDEWIKKKYKITFDDILKIPDDLLEKYENEYKEYLETIKE